MLLSELMINFLSSDWAYGSFIIGLMAVTLIVNIMGDKKDKRGK